MVFEESVLLRPLRVEDAVLECTAGSADAADRQLLEALQSRLGDVTAIPGTVTDDWPVVA